MGDRRKIPSNPALQPDSHAMSALHALAARLSRWLATGDSLIRQQPLLLIPVLLASLTGCGCDAVGYPAIDVTIRNLVTARPVSLGGAELTYGNGRQSPQSIRRPDADSSSRFSICCSPGTWRVQIAKAGYLPFDTTVRVRSTGRCDRPVLLYLLAPLRPSAPLPSARTTVSAI